MNRARPRRRWKGTLLNVARLAIASFLLLAVVADTSARLARLQLASLPDFDATAEVARLRGEGRFGEAVMIADATIEENTDVSVAELDGVKRERQLALDEQASWARRIKDAGIGAVTGGAGMQAGEMSLEMLIGAIATDMLVIGDVRDLVIQSARAVRGDDVDEVIVALSAIGVATTIVPEIDWAPAILKAGRKIGALGDRLGNAIVGAAKSGDVKALGELQSSISAISKNASPGSAARMLRHAGSIDEVSQLAGFISRFGKRGARALHVTQEAGAGALRHADELRAAGRLDEAASIERLVIRAAKKGEGGARWLRGGGYRAIIRPHPIVGVLKGVYKGHAAAVVQRALEALDLRAWWVIPALAAWVFVECALLGRRLAWRRE